MIPKSLKILTGAKAKRAKLILAFTEWQAALDAAGLGVSRQRYREEWVRLFCNGLLK